MIVINYTDDDFKRHATAKDTVTQFQKLPLTEATMMLKINNFCVPIKCPFLTVLKASTDNCF